MTPVPARSALSDAPATARSGRCLNCREPGALRSINDRLLLCAACRFIWPTESPVAQSSPIDQALLAPLLSTEIFRDRYRVLRQLGAGPHGVTLLAEHRLLAHPCVIKLLPFRAERPSDEAVTRLRNEARAGLRVNSPNVVRVLDCGRAAGAWYFVMEYIDGVDLASVLRAGLRVDWRQAVELASDAAAGLVAIHRAGLIHRDVKPGNLILAGDGRLCIADLGVARFVETHITPAGVDPPSGTLAYAAPETLTVGARVDARADLYSLGATLYELINARLPHGAASVYRALLGAQRGQIEWPGDAPCDVPPWLADAILRLLRPAPQDRFESAEEFLEYLQHGRGAARAAIPPEEVGGPRGLTVLAFENASGEATDDWLSLALADHLSRGLSRAPDVYVADRDEFVRVLERVRPDGAMLDVRTLRDVGRLTGAAHIVRGRFQRREGRLTVWVEVLSASSGRCRVLEPVEGSLSALHELRGRLLRRVCQAMGVSEPPAYELAAGGPPPAAQEAFFAAKRAHLQGDYEAAIERASAAVALAPEFCEAIGTLGACCSRLGRYEEAERHHLRQEELAARQGDGRQVVEAYANLGVMHYFRGEYADALRYYERAAHTAEALGLTNELAQVYNNLGFVQFRLGRLTEARAAFQRAIETHKAFGALVFLIGPYNGMGNVLRSEQRYEEAREYYQRALALALECDDRVNVGISYMHLGRCALKLGRFAAAKHELAMALSALEETRFWNGLTRVYESIAEMNLQLQNYAEAARCADRQIELARAHANRTMEAAAWRVKAQALRGAGQLGEAESCLVQAAALEAPVCEAPAAAAC